VAIILRASSKPGKPCWPSAIESNQALGLSRISAARLQTSGPKRPCKFWAFIFIQFPVRCNTILGTLSESLPPNLTVDFLPTPSPHPSQYPPYHSLLSRIVLILDSSLTTRLKLEPDQTVALRARACTKPTSCPPVEDLSSFHSVAGLYP